MKKILHIITTLNRGGAENHLAALVSAQIKQGFGLTIAYLKGDGYWAKNLESKGVTVIPLRLLQYGDPFPVLRLQKIIRNLKPDIIHTHLQPAELYARLALLLTGQIQPPLIISKHNDEPFCPGPLQDLLGRWVAKRAAHFIAISNAVNRFFRDDLGLEENRITTIHYGIDPAPYTAAAPADAIALRKEWGVPEDAWLLGTVARLVPQKALHVLISAYALYCKTATCPSRLVFVGRGPLEEELKALADRLNVAKNIIWAGFREDIPVVMKALDVFVLSSIYEGFGLVLLEASASAKPIVATNVSAIPEVVSDSKTGLLCAKNDDAEMARAFAKLENGDLRQALGQAGLKRVLEEFTIEKMAEKTEAIYRQSSAF